jgi:PDZ domain-containing protein
MSSLLLLCALAAAGAEPPAAEEAKKTPPKVVVKSFVVSRDGDGEMLDDQGVAWVEPGQGGPMQLIDMLGPRRYIGVQLITLTPELRRHFGVPDDRGVMVSKVIADTPAAQAGIAVGDVLVSADGSPIGNAGDVSDALKEKEPGDHVQIDAWRNGQRVELAVGFEEREAKTFNLAAPAMIHPMMLHDHGEMPADAHALADRTFTFRAVRQEELDDTLRALDEYFKSPEWQERVQQLKNLDLEAVQQRMKTLEQRLQDLERQLAEKRR